MPSPLLYFRLLTPDIRLQYLPVVGCVRKKSDLTGSQDRFSQLALISCRNAGDAAGQHLAGGRYEEFEQFRIFIIQLPGRILLEGIDFSAASPVDASIFRHFFCPYG